jgi:hypothetical protein
VVDRERDVLQRLEVVDAAAAERMEGPFLEGVDPLARHAEALRDTVDDDGRRACIGVAHRC